MNLQLLQEIGLSKSQALVYLKLIEKGELTPPEVAQLTGESRPNAYMILRRLKDLELIEKMANSKKVSYQALNPIALERLIENKRLETSKVEQQVKQLMPQMLSYYYSFTEKPGIRLLQGIEGLKEIYRDTLRTKEDIYFMRTPAEIKVMGEEFFKTYKKRRAALGITTYAITVGPPTLRRSLQDDAFKMVRTWIKAEDYTAPVEINVYGDKVAYLVYGEEIMGVIIQSSFIAESMRQIFQIVQNAYSKKRIVSK
jgi:sugar-specific transcriptional regulator TrmB